MADEIPLPAEFDTLKSAIRSLATITWIQTHDVPRWLEAIKTNFYKAPEFYIYQPFMKGGKVPLTGYPPDLRGGSDERRVEVYEVIDRILSAPRMGASMPVLFVPNPSLSDSLIRSVRDTQDRHGANNKWISLLVFLSGDPIPNQFTTFAEVIVDKGPTVEEMKAHTHRVFTVLNIPTDTIDTYVETLRGLSLHQADHLLARTLIESKSFSSPRTIHLDHLKVLRANTKGAYEER